LFEFATKEIRWNGSVPHELAGAGRFVIPHHEFVPAYLKTYEEGRLREKAAEALELLRNCHVCPRNCEVNRLDNKTGICKSGRLARNPRKRVRAGSGLRSRGRPLAVRQALAPGTTQVRVCRDSSGSVGMRFRASFERAS